MRLGSLLVAGLLVSAPCEADADPTLEQVQYEYGALEYEKSIETARAVVRRGGNGPDEYKKVHEILGKALAITGQERQAKEHFRHVLALDSGFRLPAGDSPKLRRLLSEVRAEWGGRAGLTIGHQPPTEGDPDHPLVLRVNVTEDPLSMVSAVRAQYKLPGQPTWSGLKVDGSIGETVVVVPLPALGARPGTFGYSLEILDRHENVLRRWGEVDAPLEVVLGKKAGAPVVAAGSPWYTKWWVWTIAGAVVAGAATAAVVSTTRPDSTSVSLGWEVK